MESLPKRQAWRREQHGGLKWHQIESAGIRTQTTNQERCIGTQRSGTADAKGARAEPNGRRHRRRDNLFAALPTTGGGLYEGWRAFWNNATGNKRTAIIIGSITAVILVITAIAGASESPYQDACEREAAYLNLKGDDQEA